jgi:CcmD family protein
MMMIMCKRVLLSIAAALFLTIPVAAFQPPAGQNEFVPVTSLPPGDQLPAAPLLIAAYAFVWVAVLVYVWSVWRRLGRVEAEMQALQKRVARTGDGAAGSSTRERTSGFDSSAGSRAGGPAVR